METQPSKLLFALDHRDFRNYDRMNVHLSKPRILAYYERRWEAITAATRIRYFKEPSAQMYPIDLNTGYEHYRKTSLYSRNVQLCLKYAMSTHKSNNQKRTKVYTRSSTLVGIMKSIHSIRNDELRICVTRYDGDLYMTVEDPVNPNNPPGDEVVMSPQETHHNQLKRYLYADSPNETPNINEPWDENVELLAVRHSILNKYDIIYSDSVHAIISDEEFKDFDNMDALSNCRFVLTKEMWSNFRYKSNKYLHYLYYARLGNVNDIYVAYKNRRGIIEKRLEHIIVKNLSKDLFSKLYASEAFLYDFLQRVERLMLNVNCLNTVYLFKKKPSHHIHYQIFEGKTAKTFITEEYKDYCRNKNK